MSYLKRAQRARTPQSHPLPGSGQVPNSAGGFAWALDKWDRLSRFLVLGSEHGTYYIGERDLTFENVACLHECVAEDGARFVAEVVAVSQAGRAPRNDQAIFALAYAISNGDPATKRLAANAIPQVCRIGTHLFMLLDFLKGETGWGALLRACVSKWYTEKSADQVAYQAVKYRQRGGWSHRDVLRLAHPKAPTDAHAEVFGFISGNLDHGQTMTDGMVTRPAATWMPGEGVEVPKIIEGFLAAERAKTPKETAALVREYRLPREALLTDHLKSSEVWEALLDAGMPMTALIRNLATMTRIGLLTPTSLATGTVLAQLTDADYLRKARVHPLAVLIAQRVYHSGHSFRGTGEWTPVPQIMDALDAAFYKSFEFVEPTGKRFLIGIDISGSMTSNRCHGTEVLRCHEAAAAMAMTIMRTEPLYEVVGYDTRVYDLGLSAGMRLPDVLTAMRFRGGGTDCSLPMQYATGVGREVDCFVNVTDNETWAGAMHPSEALKQYRRESELQAKLVVMGMASSGFTTADPNDAGMLDVVGFDASVPPVIAEFVGR